MRKTRIALGLDPDDFIEVEGNNGNGRLTVSDTEFGVTRKVVQGLDSFDIMRLVNALLICLMSEEMQAEIEQWGENGGLHPR